MSTPVLEVSHWNAYYGKAQILFDVNLNIHRGEIVALMGRNGAGKSTTFKSIMGHLKGTEGTLKLHGREIQTLPIYQRANGGIGFVPEDRRIFSDLTVDENLDLGRKPGQKGSGDGVQWELDEIFQIFPNLAKMRNRLGTQMSGGEQQMLTIARTLMGNPEVILLDEPSEGVAPLIVEYLANVIMKLKDKGLTIILAEQNLAFTTAVADRAYVLDRGNIVFDGAMNALVENDEVCRTYLTI